jgi:hypothetical protein
MVEEIRPSILVTDHDGDEDDVQDDPEQVRGAQEQVVDRCKRASFVYEESSEIDRRVLRIGMPNGCCPFKDASVLMPRSPRTAQGAGRRPPYWRVRCS